jgi:hypothetical protein
MLILTSLRKRIPKKLSILLSVLVTSIATLTTIIQFSEYTLEIMHVLDHLIFIIILLFFTNIVGAVTVPGIRKFFNYLEIEIFDKIQYIIAQTVMSIFKKLQTSLETNIFDKTQYTIASTIKNFSINVRKTQTGNLNFNLIGILIGFIICILFILFNF